VVDRLVPGAPANRADPLVHRVLAERNRRALLATPEVTVHRFPDDGGHTHAAPQGGVAQLAVGLLREAQVGDDVTGHGGITISQYRLESADFPRRPSPVVTHVQLRIA
jgi:hypothetical protein